MPTLTSPAPTLTPMGRHTQVCVTHQSLSASWFIRHAAPAAPQALMRTRSVGEMLLLGVSSQADSGYLDAQAHGGQGFFCLSFQLAGTQYVHAPQSLATTVAPGEVLLWSSQMSGEFLFPAAFEQQLLLIPLAQMAREWPHLCQAAAPRCLAPNSVLKSMAFAGMRALWQQDAHSAEPADSSAALLAIVDLLHRAERPAQARRGTKADLYSEILRFIDTDLENEALGPLTLARRFNCSVRGLHALFAQQGQTVAGRIRQRRLEQCRMSLADPRGSACIGDLALQWGFSDAAHFSKLFKATYGQSPRSYMSQVRAM